MFLTSALGLGMGTAPTTNESLRELLSPEQRRQLDKVQDALTSALARMEEEDTARGED